MLYPALSEKETYCVYFLFLLLLKFKVDFFFSLKYIIEGVDMFSYKVLLCSSRGAEFGFKYLYHVVHNCFLNPGQGVNTTGLCIQHAHAHV